MLRRTSSILISFIVIAVSGSFCVGACPSADLTGDCIVDYEDFAIMANQWLTSPFPGDMVFIPGGTFEMGDSLGDGPSHALPVHTVTVDSFCMGKCEITNQQYCDYLNSALAQGLITVYYESVFQAGSGMSYDYCNIYRPGVPSQIEYSSIRGVFSVRTKNGRDMSNDPMVMVLWYGAVAYCNWRSQQEGREQCYDLATWDCDFTKNGYRLPTEAEWEYAARGGLSGRRFPWGDTISHSQANYRSTSYDSYDISPTEGYHPTWNDGEEPYTSPGRSFAANGYRLYDIAGNVGEWCNDWYSSSYYNSSPTDNPTGPVNGSLRIVRGGAYSSSAYLCRVAGRFTELPGTGYGRLGLGFRLVLDLE